MDHLSTDVFQDLVAWIDSDDLKNLRLTSKSLDSATEQAFWTARHVKVVINEPGNETSLAKLEEFTAKPEAAGRIQRLELDVSIQDLDEKAYKRFREILGDGLRVLKGLRSIRWKVSGDDPEWVPNTICEALATLPLLSSLSIKASWMQDDLPPLPLHLFTHGSLEVLSIFYPYKDPSLYIQPLQALITNNPNLTHLDLQFHPQFTLPVTPFSDLFTVPFSKSLRLESLTLVGWTLDFTTDVLPHIRGLRTLELLDRQQDIGTSYWDVLRSSETHLRSVTVSNPTSEFVDYISSFSGLEILLLQDAGMIVEQGESDELARKFYGEVLPRHRATLKEVSISSLGPELWTFGAWNASAFDGCTELVSLGVNVGEDDILVTGEVNVVGTLVKHALTLPNLRTLTITPVFNPRDGGGMSFIATGLDAVENVVENLELALKEPPSLTILIYGRRGKYIPELVSEGEVRYKFISDY
ncbi:hypothetical protein AAF712_003388 [Marasmius tenuissimus]|uniref:F-box domain-containing protein n=1 Tax=Marasmius tenuissimus TaxID=585030 RepID=A0ABR3A6Z9_9AGAR|nr:hypothetical protein PM082_003828 [Marasmius tenuissimus]